MAGEIDGIVARIDALADGGGTVAAADLSRLAAAVERLKAAQDPDPFGGADDVIEEATPNRSG